MKAYTTKEDMIPQKLRIQYRRDVTRNPQGDGKGKGQISAA